MMSNRTSQILSQWLPLKDDYEWVLGTVIQTDGPCYRKTGAMMMINSLGQWFGMLSGGCLESDLLKHARQVMQTGTSQIVTYDALDDDEASWLSGVGCGGKVVILLQPVTANNHYMELDKIQRLLAKGEDCHYKLDYSQGEHSNNQLVGISGGYVQDNSCDAQSLTITFKADPQLAIFGAGVDAIPLVNIARELGWRLLVIDHRLNSTRQQKYFQGVMFVAKKSTDISKYPQIMQQLASCNAAIIMTHNLSLDAEALSLLSKIYQPLGQSEDTHKKLNYIGLLGPESRKRKVCMMADLHRAFPEKVLHGPAGLDIGGEIPESIALSILSEIHQVIEEKQQANYPNENLINCKTGNSMEKR